MTLALILLIASLALQLVAAALAIRLVRVSGTLGAWVFIAAASVLMAIRRGVALEALIVDRQQPKLLEESLGLVISFLLVAAMTRLAYFFDGTRAARERLAVSESRYRELVDQLPQPVFETDRDGNLTLANRAALDSYGYSKQDLEARLNVFDLLVDEDRPRAMQNAKRVMGGGESLGEVYSALRKDGSSFASQVYTAPILEHGIPVGLRGISLDISRSKRDEEVLQAHSRQQAAVADLGQLALVSSDLVELFQAATDRVAATLGVEYCKILELLPNGRELLLRAGVGWQPGVVGHRRVGTGRDSQAGYTLESDHPVVVEDFALETRFVAPPILVEHGVVSGMSTVLRAGGRPWGVLGAHARKRREYPDDDVHFLRAVGNLISSAIDRERLEREVILSQKLEAVGRLAGGVAHDFNNVLTVILGHAALLKARLAPGIPAQRDVAEVQTAGERAATLTRQLLSFSRRHVAVPSVLDLNQVVGGMESMIRRLIGENIRLETRLAPGIGPTRADRGQLEQVVMNFVVNARDAMPNGGTLTISTLQASGPLGPGECVILEVADTGTGIDESVRAHLFEPFYTTKEEGKGTGLGLATAYRIVKEAGGDILVEGEPGQGAVFRACLPLVEGEAERPDAGPAPAAGAARPRETVLVVEDDDDVRGTTTRILARDGYRVLEARDGETALAVALAHPGPIELLLSDVVLPGITGPMLHARLQESRPDIRVLFVSGYTHDALAPLGFVDPGTGFLQKPWAPEVLRARLGEVLRGARSA